MWTCVSVCLSVCVSMCVYMCPSAHSSLPRSAHANGGQSSMSILFQLHLALFFWRWDMGFASEVHFMTAKPTDTIVSTSPGLGFQVQTIILSFNESGGDQIKFCILVRQIICYYDNLPSPQRSASIMWNIFKRWYSNTVYSSSVRSRNFAIWRQYKL